jgi:hypothetical protein
MDRDEGDGREQWDDRKRKKRKRKRKRRGEALTASICRRVLAFCFISLYQQLQLEYSFNFQVICMQKTPSLLYNQSL